MPNTSDFNDEDINVEEIMEKVKQNIKKRKEAETLLNTTSNNIRHDFLSEGLISEGNVQRDLDYINSHWEINNSNYFINSHRPVMGKFLVKGRKLVHGEIRRYVDPITWKQSEFNGSAARLLKNVNSRLNSFDTEIDQLKPEIDIKINQLRPEIDTKINQLRPEIDTKINQLRPELDTKINQLRPEIDTKINQLRPEIDTKIDKLRLEMNKKLDLLRVEFLEKIITEIDTVTYSIDSGIDNKKCLSSLENKIGKDLEHKKTILSGSQHLDTNYLKFEDKFRGSSEDIKERQSRFIHYFTGCSNVLDIGSGRGEFLELAQEQGIGAKGIDIDDTMVDFCISKGLNVIKDDANSYLEELDDKSLDGIFIDQVVEHLEPNYMIKLLALCYQKMKYGYYIVIETVNPLSLFSFANFYIDLTHIKPVHPETLKFLIKSSGFRDLDIKFISPVPADSRLKKIPINSEMQDGSASFIEAYNQNIDMLNNVLYGAQDYAVIGKK